MTGYMHWWPDIPVKLPRSARLEDMMDGLTVGRIVHFVSAVVGAGCTPAVVVKVTGPNLVNLRVFADAPGDLDHAVDVQEHTGAKGIWTFHAPQACNLIDQKQSEAADRGFGAKESGR